MAGSSIAGSGEALAVGAGEAEASVGAGLAGSGEALAVGAGEAPPALVLVPSVLVVDCELEHAIDAAQTTAMNPERQEPFMLLASLHFTGRNRERLDGRIACGSEGVHQLAAAGQENFRERDVGGTET